MGGNYSIAPWDNLQRNIDDKMSILVVIQLYVKSTLVFTVLNERFSLAALK